MSFAIGIQYEYRHRYGGAPWTNVRGVEARGNGIAALEFKITQQQVILEPSERVVMVHAAGYP